MLNPVLKFLILRFHSSFLIQMLINLNFEFFRSLICSAKFLSPEVLLVLKVFIWVGLSSLQLVWDLKLCILVFVISSKSFLNFWTLLILSALQSLLQFLLHVHHLSLKFADFVVLLCTKELNVLVFILQLLHLAHKLIWASMQLLLELDDVHMQLVVLGHHSLILPLQWLLVLRLSPHLGFKLIIHLLQLVKCFRRFEQIIQQLLRKRRTLKW